MAMQWLVAHWFAVVLFLAYTGLLVWHARAGLRAAKSTAGFFIGDRRLGGAAIGVSFYATFASTNSYVGNAGKGYEYGVAWLVVALMMVVSAWISWRLVAPRMRRFTAAWGSLTVPDFLATRFASERVRVASALVIAFSSLLYLVAVFKGAGKPATGIPRHSLPSGGGCHISHDRGLYVGGGFLSVVRSDVVQGILMIVGSVLLFYFVTRAAGGVTAIADLPDRADTAHLFELNAAIPFVVLLGIGLAGSLKLLVDPRQVTRFYGLRDERSVRIGVWVAVAGILVVLCCLFPIGLYARFLLDSAPDTDLIVPILVNDSACFRRWWATSS